MRVGRVTYALELLSLQPWGPRPISWPYRAAVGGSRAVAEADGRGVVDGTREGGPLRCLRDLQCASCSARSS